MVEVVSVDCCSGSLVRLSVESPAEKEVKRQSSSFGCPLGRPQLVVQLTDVACLHSSQLVEPPSVLASEHLPPEWGHHVEFRLQMCVVLDELPLRANRQRQKMASEELN